MWPISMRALTPPLSWRINSSTLRVSARCLHSYHGRFQRWTKTKSKLNNTSPVRVLTPTITQSRKMAKMTHEQPLDLPQLLENFEEHYPKSWHEDKWYLTAIGSLIGSNKASLCGDLYKCLIAKPRCSTPEQRQHLVRRMREYMVKCIILNGIPVIFEAVLAVAGQEQEEDKDYSFSREGWVPDRANEAKGLDVLRFLYREDHAKIMDRFHAHRDLPFISTEISYGLFLADHSILDLVESELVILPAIMCQNLPGPTLWHLRGCLRAGISAADTERIQQCIEMIARYAERPIDKIGRVEDVKEELHDV